MWPGRAGFAVEEIGPPQRRLRAHRCRRGVELNTAARSSVPRSPSSGWAHAGAGHARRGRAHRRRPTAAVDARSRGSRSPTPTRRRRPRLGEYRQHVGAHSWSSAPSTEPMGGTPWLSSHAHRQRRPPAVGRARKTLADYLREDCGLTGTHLGCEHGVCGACTILVDGDAVRSCLCSPVQADGADITTIEGIGRPDGRALRCRRRSARPRPAVRVLHPGLRGDVPASCREPRPDRRRDPRGPVGQPLPLHRLPGTLFRVVRLCCHELRTRS